MNSNIKKIENIENKYKNIYDSTKVFANTGDISKTSSSETILNKLKTDNQANKLKVIIKTTY